MSANTDPLLPATCATISPTIPVVAVMRIGGALAIGLPTRLTPLVIATGVLLVIVFVFRPEWVLPALERVIPVPASDADLAGDVGRVSQTAFA